jgi:hypothetical protein
MLILDYYSSNTVFDSYGFVPKSSELYSTMCNHLISSNTNQKWLKQLKKRLDKIAQYNITVIKVNISHIEKYLKQTRGSFFLQKC